MSDTTVAAPPPWVAARRPRPTWGLHEGDELVPGRTVLRRIGGGRRYEAFLVWDEHRLAVLVAKVLRPDMATEPTALRDLEREAGFVASVVMPLVKQRNPRAREQAADTVEQLVRLGDSVRSTMLRRALREYTTRS